MDSSLNAMFTQELWLDQLAPQEEPFRWCELKPCRDFGWLCRFPKPTLPASRKELASTLRFRPLPAEYSLERSPESTGCPPPASA